MSERPSPLRVFALWLLYALVGLVLVIAASASATPGSSSAEPSPTRLRTKIVSGLSGVALAAGVLGTIIFRDPQAKPEAALTLAAIGWGTGALLSVVAWVMIAADLREIGARS